MKIKRKLTKNILVAGFINVVFNLNPSEANKRFSLDAGFIKTRRRFL